MMKVIVEDTQSERMLTSYAGIDEKKGFLKIHYHCIVVGASIDSTTNRKGKGRR